MGLDELFSALRDAGRRVYTITDEGLKYLHGWAATIRRTGERLTRFLAEYEARFPSEAERR